MKRSIYLMLCILLSATFCSCSTGSDTPGSSTNASISDNQSAESDTPNNPPSDYIQMSSSKDGVNEFMYIVNEMYEDGLYSGYVLDEAHCYNVTPQDVAERTNYKIFKFSDSCASFVMIDDAVYELCLSFDGYGFINAVPCDFDSNGKQDLLVASSCGSGTHQSQITVFNVDTKESTIVYDISETDTPNTDISLGYALYPPEAFEGTPIYYSVYTIEIDNSDNDFSNLKYAATGGIGYIVSKDGVPVFQSTVNGQFSYTVDSYYWEEDISGVKKDGFKNVTPQPIQNADDAIALAKKEAIVSYNQISVDYDDIEKVWRVIFSTEDMLGGDQSVYLDENGLTLVCVWGE